MPVLDPNGLSESIIMKIKHAISDKEKSELDQLLWDVLWRPLGFPRGIRQSFKLNNSQIDLIAVDNGVVIGGLMGNWLSENEIEIRHIAVSPDFQRLLVGKRLVEKFIKLSRKDNPVKIQVHARNTSVGFFTKLGFISSGKHLEHKDFARHGIKFTKCILKLNKRILKWNQIK